MNQDGCSTNQILAPERPMVFNIIRPPIAYKRPMCHKEAKRVNDEMLRKMRDKSQ